MYILFIVKVNILELIKWSYRSLAIMLTIEPKMVKIFWARSPISFKHVFLVLILTSTPNRTPPKDRWLTKKSNQVMPAYLNNVVSLSKSCEILASETIVLIKEDQMDKRRREQDKWNLQRVQSCQSRCFKPCSLFTPWEHCPSPTKEINHYFDSGLPLWRQERTLHMILEWGWNRTCCTLLSRTHSQIMFDPSSRMAPTKALMQSFRNNVVFGSFSNHSNSASIK